MVFVTIFAWWWQMEGSTARSVPLTNGSGYGRLKNHRYYYSGNRYLRSMIHTYTGMHFQGGGQNFMFPVIFFYISVLRAEHNLNEYGSPISEMHGDMDEWTIKTQNPICLLFFKIDLLTKLCLTDFIDWRYIHSLVGFFDPACELLSPWTKELYAYTVAPLSFL